MLVSNTDDHLRNHGFLRAPQGWRLSPAYDLNPVPVDVKPRIHALAIDEIDGTASLDTAMGVARMFGIDGSRRPCDHGGGGRGRFVNGEVPQLGFGMTPDEIDRMASAFDHDDLRAATE